MTWLTPDDTKKNNFSFIVTREHQTSHVLLRVELEDELRCKFVPSLEDASRLGCAYVE